ncbi:MAG: glycine cleavage system protein GcvH [Smithellaceae bacterium]|nr:glycine cleavage system protein GcvH [Smithellaceae bacterium]
MATANPQDRRYSEEHEWAKDNGDGSATMGITDHAQELLTDIVYVELPVLGKHVKKGEPVAVVESVKSVSDVFAPVSGEVIAVNDALENEPGLINQDAFGTGWVAVIKMDNPSELGALLDADGYANFIAAEEH